MIENLLRRILRHRDIMNGGDLYLRRFYLGPQVFGHQLMLHHIVRADKERDLHDHPWPFWTFCLRGGYLEETVKDEPRTAHVSWQLKYRGAEFKHRIDRIFGQCWTLVLSGREIRQWGFYTEKGWVHWREYLGIPTGDDTSKP